MTNSAPLSDFSSKQEDQSKGSPSHQRKGMSFLAKSGSQMLLWLTIFFININI